eukprot:30924-Pelagococcus_subviridis.AAC.7
MNAALELANEPVRAGRGRRVPGDHRLGAELRLVPGAPRRVERRGLRVRVREAAPRERRRRGAAIGGPGRRLLVRRARGRGAF